MERKVGLTKDVGWEFGIRKSVSINSSQVWNFLFSESATKLWFKGVDKNFSTFKPFSHVRTKWKLKEWRNEATLQMRVVSGKDKTTIAFHLERLLDENQREETKAYWTKTLDNIITQLNKKKRTANSACRLGGQEVIDPSFFNLADYLCPARSNEYAATAQMLIRRLQIPKYATGFFTLFSVFVTGPVEICTIRTSE